MPKNYCCGLSPGDRVKTQRLRPPDERDGYKIEITSGRLPSRSRKRAPSSGGRARDRRRDGHGAEEPSELPGHHPILPDVGAAVLRRVRIEDFAIKVQLWGTPRL